MPRKIENEKYSNKNENQSYVNSYFVDYYWFSFFLIPFFALINGKFCFETNCVTRSIQLIYSNDKSWQGVKRLTGSNKVTLKAHEIKKKWKRKKIGNLKNYVRLVKMIRTANTSGTCSEGCKETERATIKGRKGHTRWKETEDKKKEVGRINAFYLHGSRPNRKNGSGANRYTHQMLIVVAKTLGMECSPYKILLFFLFNFKRE